MLTRTSADRFAASWINAWNSHDIDRLDEHYDDDVELWSPFIASVAGEPTGSLHGKPAAKAYWIAALARFPDLHFVLLNTFAGAGSITLRYRSVLDLIACETFILSGDRRIIGCTRTTTSPISRRRPHRTPPAPLLLTHITPILNVSNVAESMAWFEKLGFRRCWDLGSPPAFGSVGAGEHEIFQCLNGQGGRGRSRPASTGGPHGSDDRERGVWMSLWVDDVDAVHRRCLERGLDVTFPPTDEPWGVRDMHVRHPDGHVFRISKPLGHEP